MGSGSGSEDSISRKPSCHHGQTKYKVKILLIIVLTNLLTIYLFTGPHTNFQYPPAISRLSQLSITPMIWDSTPLMLKLNATQAELLLSYTQIESLRHELKSANSMIQDLLSRLNAVLEQNMGAAAATAVKANYDDVLADISDEAALAIGPHKLPLGPTPLLESEIAFSVGGRCLKHKEDLWKYMSYDVGKDCPVDDVFAQKLMLKGCEPLPRRRCHPKSPVNYVEPTPFPESLWTTPPDTSIIWDPYTCKNYTCLKERRNTRGVYDCKDCFYLDGRESKRWMYDNGNMDFGIQEVLAMKPRGTIRIGLDLGGGSGTFAARMIERNITIVTTSMNFDGPFNSFIASRGLIAMHVTISQRLPFFENTLDIVHSMHVLSNWIPDTMFEFILYDIYRVLRPGGIFWLDRFFCFGVQLNGTYVPMFQRVGFTTLRRSTAMKLDQGKNEWYFSAIFEKPMT